MAAASGEKDGFPLGPQLFLPFRWRAAQDLVQGAPLTPITPFPLHQVSSSFRRRAVQDLVQGTPLTLITPFPLHQISSSFRWRAAQDLVQGAPLTLITPFPLHQVSSSFRWRAAPDLVQGAPLTLIVPCPLHQVPPTFPYCGPPAGGAAHICICTQIICSILCTWLIFYCIPQILEYNIVYQNNRTTRRDRRSSEGRELLREFKKIY